MHQQRPNRPVLAYQQMALRGPFLFRARIFFRGSKTARQALFWIKRDVAPFIMERGPIMKKLRVLSIIVGGALLAAVPLSPQWSPEKKVVLSLDRR